MAYFLKKSTLKKGVYLQIYESFYNPDKRQTAHRSFKAIGYVSDLVSSGMEDPMGHYSQVVREMNEAVKQSKQRERERQISTSPEKHVGYFLLKAVFDGLHVSNYLDLLQTPRNFRFRIADVIEALVYCRVTEPCSKSKTYSEVLPSLYGAFDLSYDQILDGVEYIGSEYEKIIEIFNHQLNLRHPTDTSTTYFDGTNFYFEIDREDDLRRKGPSKENRRDPIVGLGLLLDAHQVPIGMKLYPGNESEKPVIREVIQDLKSRHSITGRTIQVADKGLNCAANILDARKNGDGYIFSKSVKMLPDTEKTWVLLAHGYHDVLDKEGELLYKIKACVDKFPYVHTNEAGKKVEIMLHEKRVVTFNPKLAEKKRQEIKRMVEKARALKASEAKKAEFGDCGKYVLFASVDAKGVSTDARIAVSLNQAAIDEDLRLAGYNLLVSSETRLSDHEIYATYHLLWRIEETFRMMKSYLDARPVFLQKRNSIFGHFLICYLSVLLTRILQFHVFDNRYCSERFFDLAKEFRVVETQRGRFLNITPTSDFICDIAARFSLPLTSYYLSAPQLNNILSLALSL